MSQYHTLGAFALWLTLGLLLALMFANRGGLYIAGAIVAIGVVYAAGSLPQSATTITV